MTKCCVDDCGNEGEHLVDNKGMAELACPDHACFMELVPLPPKYVLSWAHAGEESTDKHRVVVTMYTYGRGAGAKIVADVTDDYNWLVEHKGVVKNG